MFQKSQYSIDICIHTYVYTFILNIGISKNISNIESILMQY